MAINGYLSADWRLDRYLAGNEDKSDGGGKNQRTPWDNG
jgi:hypothetical protein